LTRLVQVINLLLTVWATVSAIQPPSPHATGNSVCLWRRRGTIRCTCQRGRPSVLPALHATPLHWL